MVKLRFQDFSGVGPVVLGGIQSKLDIFRLVFCQKLKESLQLDTACEP